MTAPDLVEVEGFTKEVIGLEVVVMMEAVRGVAAIIQADKRDATMV